MNSIASMIHIPLLEAYLILVQKTTHDQGCRPLLLLLSKHGTADTIAGSEAFFALIHQSETQRFASVTSSQQSRSYSAINRLLPGSVAWPYPRLVVSLAKKLHSLRRPSPSTSTYPQ